MHFLRQLSLLAVFSFFVSCSGDDSPSACSRVTDVNFNAYTTTVELFLGYEGDANSFRVEYGPSGFIPGTGMIFQSSNTQITIDDLAAETVYDFYITGICSSQKEGNTFELLSVTTEQNYCDGQISANFYQFSNDALEIEVLYSNGFQFPQTYEAEYGLEGFALGSGKRVTSSSNTLRIRPVEPSTDYDFYIWGDCEEGGQSDYAHYTITTVSSCPTPTGLGSSYISGSCSSGTERRRFYWTDLTGSASNYSISIVSSGNRIPGNGTQFITENQSITLANLFCNWEAFYVRANCSGGEESQWEGPIFF